MIGFRFGEEPVSYCYGVAGVTAPATETVSILYHVIVMKSRFLPVYIPQTKAWGFDGGLLRWSSKNLMPGSKSISCSP